MADLIELLRKRAADHGGDKLLEESAAALEAAREDACGGNAIQPDSQRGAFFTCPVCHGVGAVTQEVANQRVRPAGECPHRTRCDCLAGCKWGFASGGAE